MTAKGGKGGGKSGKGAAAAAAKGGKAAAGEGDDQAGHDLSLSPALLMEVIAVNGGHSTQDQILLVEIGEYIYMGLRVYHKYYLPWSPALKG